MTDSRAALEERARAYRDWKDSIPRCTPGCDGDLVGIEHDANCPMYAVEDSAGRGFGATFKDAFYAGRKSAEQESSSLKLLLSAMCNRGCHLFNGNTEISIYPPLSDSPAKRRTFAIELDSSGIPVLTPEIIEALEAAQ